MTTYADIHERVRAKLINPAGAVGDTIPSLVFEAHKRIERMHSWQACEGEWIGYVAPDETTVRPALASRAFLRLLDRKERPYIVERASLIQTDAGTVYANYFVTTSASAAPAGADVALVVSDVAALAPIAVLARDVISASFLPGVQTYTLHDPDLGIPLTGLSTGERIVVVQAATGKRFPLEWVSDVDVRRFYSGTLSSARPKHVSAYTVAEDGAPSFSAYPPADVAHEIRVPCLLSMLSSLTELPDPSEDNWLTIHGFELLVAWAAAEAFELSWDDKRAAMQREKANALLRDLIALDASQRVYTTTLAVRDSVRGPSTQRNPKW